MANIMVIVSYKVFPAHMGGQKGIVLFYEHLKVHHNLFMVVSKDNEVDVASFPVKAFLSTNKNIWQNIFRVYSLKKLMHRHKIDCIIAEHSYTGWMAFLLRKWTGKPFIIHSHNIEADRFRQMGKSGWKFYQPYEKWIHRQADFNFFKTPEEKAKALQQYRLQRDKTTVIPYGVVSGKKIPSARQKIREKYGVQSNFIFYFNGTLDYEPNRKAVDNLLNNVSPILIKAGLSFTILISGKCLANSLHNEIKKTWTVRYLGFIEDVALLYQGCTLFLNPVINDSGVKTKLVEALANHCTVVSTTSGASGIPREHCAQKLQTTTDGNWQEFADAIVESVQKTTAETPPSFFSYFSWKNIAKIAAGHIQAIVSHE